MTFANTNPNISGAAVVRFFDSIAARDLGLPATKGVAGAIAWVQDTKAFYMLVPSDSAGNALAWQVWTGGDIGADGQVSKFLGGVQFQGRLVGDVNATVTADDYALLFDTTLTAARTVTLPAASASTRGRVIVVKSINAVNGVNTIAIAGVDGGTSTISTAYGARMLIDNGTSWSLIATV